MTLRMPQLSNSQLMGLLMGAMMATGGMVFYGVSQFSMGSGSPQSTPRVMPINKIAALGRLEPESAVLKLSTPLALDGDRIAQVLVKEGDTVQVGQVIAVLDAKDRLEDEVFQAQGQVKTAQGNLALVMAGAETGEIQVPTKAQTAAQIELDGSIAALERAESVLDRAFIRAPIAGQVLKVYAKVGEKPGTKGLADLGRTDQMVAVAEVYQTDIGKVKIGQEALVTASGFPGKLKGKVAYIDLQVNQQKVFSSQLGENLDRRVVEVKIRLSPGDSQKVSSLTNLPVQSVIFP